MTLKVKEMKRVDGAKEALYLPAIFTGLRLTVRHFFRNLLGSKDVVTFSYPEQKRPVAERWRGRHRLTRRDDGFLNCVACYMCETVCPSKCIHIEAAEHPDKSVEKYPATFDIDELRCVFCGLCVEACPKNAIRMDSGIISMTYDTRKGFHYSRDLLRDNYEASEKTKFTDADIPTPQSQAEALPNSTGIPAP